MLEAKSKRPPSSDASAALLCELQRLKLTVADIEPISVTVDAKRAALRTINEKLWDLKEAMRLCEIENRFDVRFIQIARETQALEDERTRMKQGIDNAIG